MGRLLLLAYILPTPSILCPHVYRDYGRFITRQELDKLALSHLVGTPMLRAYMHGFFLDNRLYRKAKVPLACSQFSSCFAAVFWRRNSVGTVPPC